MNRILLWATAFITALALTATVVVVFVGSLTIGFVGAINKCGISLLTASNNQQPASTPLPATDDSEVEAVEPSPSPSVTPSPDPSPSSSPTTGAETTLGSAAQQFLDQFSAAQQDDIRQNAATIISVGERQVPKLTARDVQTAVATAIQEANLINRPYNPIRNDLDSLGLFQQRPSQGWGTPEQIMDPVYSSGKFFEALARIENRESLSVMEVSIRVQIPDRSAYERRWAWDEVAIDFYNVYSTSNDGSSGSICTTAVGVSSGEWVSPLVPGSYCALDPFGMRLHPIYKEWRMHLGVDLSCNNGDPIYAVSAGTVSFAGSNGAYGEFIKLDHGDSISTNYAHMARVADGITKGGSVIAGQVIGYVGSTGGSTGAHLHFEIRNKGEAIDPDAFLNERGVDITP